MSNEQFNSLTESLIKSGIIPRQVEQNDFESLYDLELDMSNSPFVLQGENLENKNDVKETKKRINNFDMDLLKGVSSNSPIKTNIDSFRIIKRFLNFKHNLAKRGQLGLLENFLFIFFPRVYKAKLVKDAMAKFNELNIDTKTLLDKTIPYGESENRYQNLIKYLNYANEIQTKFKKND